MSHRFVSSSPKVLVGRRSDFEAHVDVVISGDRCLAVMAAAFSVRYLLESTNLHLRSQTVIKGAGIIGRRPSLVLVKVSPCKATNAKHGPIFHSAREGEAKSRVRIGDLGNPSVRCSGRRNTNTVTFRSFEHDAKSASATREASL